MEERVIKVGPGTLVGLSTNEPYAEEALFYSGEKLRLTVDLSEPMPAKTVNGISVPGCEIDMFFKESIVMRCVRGAKIDVVYSQ